MEKTRILALICFGGKIIDTFLKAAHVNKRLRVIVYLIQKFNLRNFLYETSSVSGKEIL